MLVNTEKGGGKGVSQLLTIADTNVGGLKFQIIHPKLKSHPNAQTKKPTIKNQKLGWWGGVFENADTH